VAGAGRVPAGGQLGPAVVLHSSLGSLQGPTEITEIFKQSLVLPSLQLGWKMSQHCTDNKNMSVHCTGIAQHYASQLDVIEIKDKIKVIFI